MPEATASLAVLFAVAEDKGCELALFGGGGRGGSFAILLDVLGFKTTGVELLWAALGGVDGEALGDLDLAVSLVARETAATSEAGDFGASAAEPSCFLHGWILSRGNLVEDSEVAFGDGATAFGSLSLEVVLMVTFCLLGGGGLGGCRTT